MSECGVPVNSVFDDLASSRRNFSSIVRGLLISLLLTREGPSVGSNCQHIGRLSSAHHKAL